MIYRIRKEYGIWCVRNETGWLLGTGFDIPDAWANSAAERLVTLRAI